MVVFVMEQACDWLMIVFGAAVCVHGHIPEACCVRNINRPEWGGEGGRAWNGLEMMHRCEPNTAGNTIQGHGMNS
jgi:hypothetical protein